MNTPSSKLPILIVGAGPSGLMMALMLAKLGQAVKIIDKDKTPNINSRAIVIQIRTLEIFKSLGLVQKLRKHAVILKSLSIHSDNLSVCKIDTYFADSLFHHPWIVDQSDTQKLLESELKTYGIAVQRNTEFIESVQKNNYVETKLKINNKFSSYKASYLIGADGAHSIVRKSINQKYQGKSYDDEFILADVNFTQNPQLSSAHLYLKKQKFFAVFPMKNANYRLISIKNKHFTNFDDLANMANLPNINETKWSSNFFIRCLSVDKYYDNRTFLVGDAAHIHSPAGGQGMNTGLQDSFNLAFKLSMANQGLLSSNSLKTYHEERKPVGDFLINNTDRLFNFMTSTNWSLFIMRKIILFLISVFNVPKKLTKIMSQTAITYKHGLLCKSHHNCDTKLNIGKRVFCWQMKNNLGNTTDIHSLVIGNYFSCFIIFPSIIDLNTIKKTKKDAYNKLQIAKNIRLFFIYQKNVDIEDDNEFIFSNNNQNLEQEIKYIITRPDQHIFCQDNFSNINHALKELFYQS